MPTEITVTGCGDCPMYVDLMSVVWCQHPKRTNQPKPLIDTCPLKTDSITIKLKQDEKEAM